MDIGDGSWMDVLMVKHHGQLNAIACANEIYLLGGTGLEHERIHWTASPGPWCLCDIHHRNAERIGSSICRALWGLDKFALGEAPWTEAIQFVNHALDLALEVLSANSERV